MLVRPATVTTTAPVVVPDGTVAVILVLLHVVTAAVNPLNLTELVPCDSPKFEPAIVTAAPAGPVEGERDEILGGRTTVNVTPLLFCPPTGPVVAPLGTVAIMLDALHAVTEAVVPLNLTTFVP